MRNIKNDSRQRPNPTVLTVLVITLLGQAGLGPFVHADPPDHSVRYELADLQALEEAFVELAESVRPSVVSLRTYRTIDPGRADGGRVRIPLSQGTGFVIDASGLIATNRHVIEDADLIVARLFDGNAYDAAVLQADRRSDLAVIKIDVDGLKSVRLGDLADVRPNQWAFACGNPFGLANENGQSSITYGVVSALGRQMTARLVGNSEVEYYGNLIETSANINPGNSGGPLFNIHGEVIGVVTAIETSSGVSEGRGFAIPIDKNTRRILAVLKTGQEVRYGFLGVEVAEVQPRGQQEFITSRTIGGAQITSVRVLNGPADQAGLKPNDIVIEYDGISIENADHLVRLVGFTPVGEEVDLTFLRDGVKRRTTVKVADRMSTLGVEPGASSTPTGRVRMPQSESPR